MCVGNSIGNLIEVILKKVSLNVLDNLAADRKWEKIVEIRSNRIETFKVFYFPEKICEDIIIENSNISNGVGFIATYGRTVTVTCNIGCETEQGGERFEITCNHDTKWNEVQPCIGKYNVLLLLKSIITSWTSFQIFLYLQSVRDITIHFLWEVGGILESACPKAKRY